MRTQRRGRSSLGASCATALTPRRRGRAARRIRAVAPGVAARVPARSRRHPDFRTEWWYVTGCAARRGGRRPRLSGHVLSHPAGRRRGRAAAGSRRGSCCSRTPRSPIPHAAAAARPARGARRLRPRRAPTQRRRTCASTTGRSRATATTYIARIAAREFTLDLAFTRDAADRCCRAKAAQPQGPAPDAGEPLLQPAAARECRGTRGARRSRARGHRHRVARPRMVERISRRGRGRLGLGRRQPRRRRRADGVSHPRPRRARRYWARRRAARRAGTRHECSHPATCASRRCARGARPARASTTPSNAGAGRRRSTTTLEPLFDDQELDARASVGHRLLGRRSHRAPRRSRRQAAAISSSPATASRCGSSHAASFRQTALTIWLTQRRAARTGDRWRRCPGRYQPAASGCARPSSAAAGARPGGAPPS